MNKTAWLGLFVASCSPANGGSDAHVDGTQEVAIVRGTVNRDLDVLFVIDDSTNMIEWQDDLKNNFPSFVQTLSGMTGGMPNLHLGVVTSDVGTQGADDPSPGPSIGSGPGSCNGVGKAGNLQTFGSTNLQAGAMFISNIEDNTGARRTNYTGTLADTFTQIASAGATGCGFEQHLEAARRALAGNPANAGFLRPSAALAVIVLGDEDDCSMAHSSLMGTDNATLGPIGSFRCTRFGVTCDQGGATPDQMNQPGMKSGCHSNDASAYLTAMPRYESFFAGLKADPHDVMLGAIVGDPTPVTVELRTPPSGGSPIPTLTASCITDGNGNPANPGVRLAQLTNSFGVRGLVARGCEQDLSPSLAALARRARETLGDPCLARDIALPPDCKAFDVAGPGVETQLPACPASGDCFAIETDASCPGQHLKLAVTRVAPPPAGTDVSVRCKL